jgi:hypothetical protein
MRLILGSVIKNIAKHIPSFVKFCLTLQSLIEDFQICIYENNSTDGTQETLDFLRDLGNHVHIKSETLDPEYILHKCKAWTWDRKPCRMECIAVARNKLLALIESVGYTDSDFVLMLDPDCDQFPDPIYIASLLDSFPEDTDAIFANGLTIDNLGYYDCFALRTSNNPVGPELLGDSKYTSLEIQEPLKIYSGFGGAVLYRAYCLYNNKYSALPTQELNTMNIELLKKHPQELPEVLTHSNGSLLGCYLFGLDSPFYRNNSGYAYPIVCEHSTFHATLFCRGQGRFFIDPNFRYFSNHYRNID